MRRCLIAVVLLTACSGTASTTTGAVTPSTTASGPTTSVPTLVECDNPPYRIGEFPASVEGAATDPSLIDLDAQWPNLRALKDDGRARYIGVTAAQAALYERLEAFLARERPDFVEINYSVTEREAERRLLPMLAERDIAVLISRPFMNGAYFERLANVPLPDWTAEFECKS